MDSLIKILVVEDEMLIGAKISMLLTNLGYEVTGILPRGEDAILHAQKNQPDIILLDVNLKGKMDGIETAAILHQKDIPVIYLTANADEATFNRAKQTRPAAFITKPFKQLDLQRAIELTISRMEPVQPVDEPVQNDIGEEAHSFILSDRIFCTAQWQNDEGNADGHFVHGSRPELQPHLYQTKRIPAVHHVKDY